MLGRPAVERAAAADFEMVRADGGRGDGQDQHDRQYDQRQEEIVATIGSALAADDRRGKPRKGKLTMTAEMMDMTMLATTRHLLPL